jgi:hypothetical protein
MPETRCWRRSFLVALDHFLLQTRCTFRLLVGALLLAALLLHFLGIAWAWGCRVLGETAVAVESTSRERPRDYYQRDLYQKRARVLALSLVVEVARGVASGKLPKYP